MGVGLNQARLTSTILVPIVVSGNATYSFVVPVNPGWVISCRMETPVALTGSPTSALTRVGMTATGQEIVADVDAKGQGHIANTIVPTFDVVGSQPGTIYIQCVVSGGTTPAGTINVLLTVHPAV